MLELVQGKLLDYPVSCTLFQIPDTKHLRIGIIGSMPENVYRQNLTERSGAAEFLSEMS